MTGHDEPPVPPAPEDDRAKLREDTTAHDSSRLLEDGSERDPSRLLPRKEETESRKLLPEHSSAEAGRHLKRYPPHHPAHHPRHTAKWLAGILVLVGLYAGGMAVHDRVQERDYYRERARRLTGGDPARGPALMRAYGCVQCHTIPGVPGANGLVGPPLAGIANRVYIGGVVTNTPDNIVRWIMNPKAIDPMTAMPFLGVHDAQARHMAAYLYTLR